jgi:hypothetical protein
VSISQATMALLQGRSGGRCECCGALATNTHHRRPRGMGGSRDPRTNQASNLVRLCGSGTTGCHGAIESNRDHFRDMGFLVRQGVDPAAVPILLRRPSGEAEWVLLDEVGGVTPCCSCGIPRHQDQGTPTSAHLMLHDPARSEFRCALWEPLDPGMGTRDVRPRAHELGVPVGTGVQVELRHYGKPVDWLLVDAVDDGPQSTDVADVTARDRCA